MTAGSRQATRASTAARGRIGVEAGARDQGLSRARCPVPEEHRVLKRCLNNWTRNGHSSFQDPFQARQNRQLMAALGEIITPARAAERVINFDIARTLR